MATENGKQPKQDLEFGSSPILCKPFLKWAGGKSKLIPELIKRMPKRYNTYFEPFLGGGALFFNVQPKVAVLSDLNSELINTYQVVQSTVSALITNLKTHHYDKDYFYEIREKDRLDEYQKWNRVQRAGRFIYLNKTCFNGLHRVNSKGYFNVPFGKYSSPKICDESNLTACSRVLRNTTLKCETFESVIQKAQREDFVYLDPPYAPISKTADFTNYQKEGFGDDMQIKLGKVLEELDKKGVYFMVSNSSTDLTHKLYRKFHIDQVKAIRAINSVASKRGAVDELIVTNY